MFQCQTIQIKLMQVNLFSLHSKCNTFLLFKFEYERGHFKYTKIVYKL